MKEKNVGMYVLSVCLKKLAAIACAAAGAAAVVATVLVLPFIVALV